MMISFIDFEPLEETSTQAGNTKFLRGNIHILSLLNQMLFK